MVADQEDAAEALKRVLDQVVKDLPALEATVHIVAQIDHMAFGERTLGVGGDPRLEILQEVEATVDVAYDVDAQATRQARSMPVDLGLLGIL